MKFVEIKPNNELKLEFVERFIAMERIQWYLATRLPFTMLPVLENWKE